jgi:hypothetical protein
MVYLEGDRLTLVHYCEAGNRPRLVARKSLDQKIVEFDFVDISGSTRPSYLHHLVFTLIDVDHHTEDWTFMLRGLDVHATWRQDVARALRSAASKGKHSPAGRQMIVCGTESVDVWPFWGAQRYGFWKSHVSRAVIRLPSRRRRNSFDARGWNKLRRADSSFPDVRGLSFRAWNGCQPEQRACAGYLAILPRHAVCNVPPLAIRGASSYLLALFFPCSRG